MRHASLTALSLSLNTVDVFEMSHFAAGTTAVAQMLADATARRGAVGGGDSVAALHRAGLTANQVSHLSTGGGASLELLEGKILPGVAALTDVDE